jgi:hypothetical protein
MAQARARLIRAELDALGHERAVPKPLLRPENGASSKGVRLLEGIRSNESIVGLTGKTG